MPSPSVAEKQAEAQQVYAKIQTLQQNLAVADEKLNYANYELAQVNHQISVNKTELKVAKLNLKHSQKMIAARLVQLYTTPQSSSLEVILGASSIDDIINRVDTSQRVSSVDSQVIGAVQRYGNQVRRRGIELKSAHAHAQQIQAQRADAVRVINSESGEAQRLLASIKDEIGKLQAQQRERELQLEQAAQARISEEANVAQPSTPVIIGASAAAPEGDVVLPASSYSGVVGYAMSQLGVPYVWAGSSPGGGFDCSGLVMWAYAQVGVSLPHSSYAMWGYGTPVPRDQLEPGDILFFDGLGHVGLYIGDGEFVQAPHTGDVVKVSSLDEGYYSYSYVGARRIL